MSTAPGSADAAEETDAFASGRKGLNGTAYRIFKLLTWLMEGPHSVDDLNRRFLADPRIARTLSTDSIWLYINTLKALKCRIKRPSPRNQFRYELLFHPLGVALDPPELETLARVKIFAQERLSHAEVLTLDELIHKVVTRCLGETQEGETLMAAIFTQSRSLDYHGSRALITLMEKWADKDTLLQMTYQSPTSGESRFSFLPEAMVYEDGVLYVKGEHAKYPDPTMLRLDRILHAEPIEDEPRRQELLARRQGVTEVVLQLKEPVSLKGFIPAKSKPLPGGWTELILVTRDFFSLRQQLLSCGTGFRVLAPAQFKTDMGLLLKAMLDRYEGGAHDD